MSLKARIFKDFGSFKLDVDIEAGDESLALLGASGCGKSLSLKCISGIIKPDRGHIELNGRVLFDSEKHINLSPQQRNTGFLFQNYALFPNMSLEQNIACGAKREKDKGRRQESVERMMEKFSLTELRDRLPSQLSGGQQQRAALARILVSQPEILLLDEPFSALDSHLRFKLERELRKLMEDFGRTVILVSHDREEVYRLSDRISVMEKGRILKSGSREEVFSNPGSRSAALLTGCKNISPLRKISGNRFFASDWGMELELPEGKSAPWAGIRMHDICLGPGENSCEVRVLSTLHNPFSETLFLRPLGSGDGSIGMELPRDAVSGLSDSFSVSLPKDKILLLED